jgi:thiol:disulfide interchange protein DsbD
MEFYRKMLLILVIIVLSVLILVTVTNFQKNNQKQQSQTSNSEINIHWNTDMDAAFKLAEKSNKLVFVDFYADWCGYCKQLDEDTFVNQNVKQKFAQSYVLVKINVDQNPELASKYQVYGLPTLVVMDSNGNVIKRQEGFVSAGELLNIL